MQVQAEPATINHVHVEGRSWTFNLEDELHTRFTGVAIELMPIVLIRVAFADGDTYTWHKVSSTAHLLCPAAQCIHDEPSQGLS